jgi:manganese/zinc/iron transport system permease protein
MPLRVLANQTIASVRPAHGAPTSITNVTDTWPDFATVIETMSLRAGFNTNMVIAGTTFLGLAAGVIGVFALLRKRSLMTDALSHATLPGIAGAFIVASALGAQGRSLPVLLLGATLTGVLGILCVQGILRHTRLREDAAIGIVLSVFFGAGIVALSYIQANAAAGSAGLNKFIYGQAATMQPGDVMLMAAIAAGAVIATALFLKEFALVCFNDAFAKVDGWPVSFLDVLMMAMVVLVTVAGLQAVGLILVVAMLIIPPVAARFWTDRLIPLLLIAALIGAASGYFGSVISALLPRKPAGAVIVLTSGVFFSVSLIFAPARGVIASALRRLRLRLLIAGEDILESAYEASLAPGATRNIRRSEIDTTARLHAWPLGLRALVTRRLRRKGLLIPRPDNAWRLTDRGFAEGARVSRNHALWEQYLVSYADIAPSHVDWSVDQVEHVLSPGLIAELEHRLASRGIEIPPPVQPIPTADPGRRP